MLKKLQELLEAEKITQELANELDVEISTLLKSKNDENARLRVEKKEAEERLKNELDAKVQEYEAKLKEAKKEGKAEVEAELSKKLQEAEAKSAEYEKGIKEAHLKALMSTTLSKFDVADIDVAESFISKFVKDGDDGFKIEVGDELLGFENGVEKLLSEKSFLLKPKGNTGSGASGANTDGFAQESITAMVLNSK